MRARGTWGWILAGGLLAALAAGPAWAADTTAAAAQLEIELRADASNARQPTVRMWVNGQEVRPGQPVQLGEGGQVRVETRVEARPSAPDRPGCGTGPGSCPGARPGSCGARPGGCACGERPGACPGGGCAAQGGEARRCAGQGKGCACGERPGACPCGGCAGQGKGCAAHGGPACGCAARAGGACGAHVPARGDRGPAGPVGDAPPRPRLGVMVSPLDDDQRRQHKTDHGVAVTDVLPDTPAAKAGLRPGDVIVGVDDAKVESVGQLADLIAGRPPGRKVRLTWLRDGRRMEEAVILGGDGPPAPPAEPGRREEGPPRREGFLGVMVAPLTDDVRQIAGTDRGVLLNSLTDGSPAADAGLLPGDVITAIDGRPVEAPPDLVDRIRDRRAGDTVRLEYFRLGKRREAKVTLGERPGEAERRPEGFRPFSIPEPLQGEMPDLREYLKGLQPQIEQWMKQWQQGLPAPDAPRAQPPGAPKVAPPGAPKVAPPEAPKAAPAAEPYDLGKDIGRILERLDRIERRLDEMEQRLNRPGR